MYTSIKLWSMRTRKLLLNNNIVRGELDLNVSEQRKAHSKHLHKENSSKTQTQSNFSVRGFGHDWKTYISRQITRNLFYAEYMPDARKDYGVMVWISIGDTNTLADPGAPPWRPRAYDLDCPKRSISSICTLAIFYTNLLPKCGQSMLLKNLYSNRQHFQWLAYPLHPVDKVHHP